MTMPSASPVTAPTATEGSGAHPVDLCQPGRLRRECSSNWTESPISQNMGGQRPTNSARRSAFPRSSWSTVFARIQSAMQR
jgi:hypothetical protein